jgi:hypothetical protein
VGNDKSHVIGSGVLVCSELDLLEGERNKRPQTDESVDESGELKKMGRQTALWLSRYYVMRDHTLFIYRAKSDHHPKRKSQPITLPPI